MSRAQNGCGVTRQPNGSGTRPRRSPRPTGFAGMSIRNRDWSRRPDRDQRQNGVAVAVPVSVADGDSGGDGTAAADGVAEAVLVGLGVGVSDPDTVGRGVPVAVVVTVAAVAVVAFRTSEPEASDGVSTVIGPSTARRGNQFAARPVRMKYPEPSWSVKFWVGTPRSLPAHAPFSQRSISSAVPGAPEERSIAVSTEPESYRPAAPGRATRFQPFSNDCAIVPPGGTPVIVQLAGRVTRTK